MKKSELKNLSDEQLSQKEANYKTMIGLFIPIILGLCYFGYKKYAAGEADTSTIAVAVCALGGMAALFPGLKDVRAEMASRK